MREVHEQAAADARGSRKGRKGKVQQQAAEESSRREQRRRSEVQKRGVEAGCGSNRNERKQGAELSSMREE
jgi:hypothetical protein